MHFWVFQGDKEPVLLRIDAPVVLFLGMLSLKSQEVQANPVEKIQVEMRAQLASRYPSHSCHNSRHESKATLDLPAQPFPKLNMAESLSGCCLQ